MKSKTFNILNIKTVKTILKYLGFKRSSKGIDVITVAKVGSSNFLHSMECEVRHDHSLLRLKNMLNHHKNALIIVGIRNPIDRNLSYLFQTYSDDFYNSVKTKKNNYKGEYCFIGSSEELIKMNNKELIEKYFKMDYHNTFNDWFSEFFEITGIDKLSFDKEKGLQYYKLPNNNVVMVYTLEKLNNNKDEICEYLKIKDLFHSNNSNERDYKIQYQDIKKNIEYPKSYLDNLLKTDIMNFFYSEEDIESFYKKYRISN